MKYASIFSPVLMVLLLILPFGTQATQKDDGWKSLFDGRTLNGWKISENESSWSVKDGAIVANGNRSHLFYVGDEKPFVDFELMVDVYTEPSANGGIYFHTKFQPGGWPKHGYEVQVNNSHGDRRKTGSLYAVKDVMDVAPAQDNKWWTQHIIVKGKQVVVKIDGKTVVDFVEEANRQPGADFTRKIDSGTFALQAHDPKSVVRFKNIRVKRLS